MGNSRSRISIDPRAIRSMAIYGKEYSDPKAREVEKFTPEMVEEVRDLFSRFDKSGDNELDRSEFGPLVRMLGLDLSEVELDRFFGKMDATGDGVIAFNELVGFLEHIAQPLTLEEELSEAFFFFEPEETREESSESGSDEEGSSEASDFSSESEYEDFGEHDIKLGPPAINAKGLAKALTGMGEEITEEECADMISAATGGKKIITFEQFQQFSKPATGSDEASLLAARSHLH